MLQCYDVTMLRCYDVTMLRCYDVTMLRCDGAMLRCDIKKPHSVVTPLHRHHVSVSKRKESWEFDVVMPTRMRSEFGASSFYIRHSLNINPSRTPSQMPAYHRVTFGPLRVRHAVSIQLVYTVWCSLPCYIHNGVAPAIHWVYIETSRGL